MCECNMWVAENYNYIQRDLYRYEMGGRKSRKKRKKKRKKGHRKRKRSQEMRERKIEMSGSEGVDECTMVSICMSESEWEGWKE